VIKLEATAENLLLIRNNANMTQSELAELMHLGAKTRISEYESGRIAIDPVRWELLLIKMGLHPEFGPRLK
jgi:transcriptional regulator with XRE-family HTH domain